MKYEVNTGHPSEGECDIVAYDGCGLYIHYRGYYDQRTGMWSLYPKGDMPDQYRKKISLRERDVRLPSRPAKEAPKKKPEPEAKPKPWWTLPDPEGQIGLI